MSDYSIVCFLPWIASQAMSPLKDAFNPAKQKNTFIKVLFQTCATHWSLAVMSGIRVDLMLKSEV